MTILPFESGPVATIGYLVIDDATRVAATIDAPFGSAHAMAAAARAAGAQLESLILTHTHWDHTGDAAELVRQHPGLSVMVHAADRHRLVEPMKHTVWPLPFEVEPANPDRLLADGEHLTIGSLDVEVIHTPGHTEGGICLFLAGESTLFSGDTLFADSIGRTDLPGGDFGTLITSIRTRLLTLPDATRVYPGHGESTTIGREKESNPFLGG